VLVTSPQIAESLGVDRRTVRYHTHKKEEPMMGRSVLGVTIGRAEGLYLLEDDPFITPPESELPDDEEPDEESQERTAEPAESEAEADGQTVTMNQLGGKRIATTALGLVAVQVFAAQFPVELPLWALLPAALIGVALIAWGMAPLIRHASASADEEVSAGV